MMVVVLAELAQRMVVMVVVVVEVEVGVVRVLAELVEGLAGELVAVMAQIGRLVADLAAERLLLVLVLACQHAVHLL